MRLLGIVLLSVASLIFEGSSSASPCVEKDIALWTTDVWSSQEFTENVVKAGKATVGQRGFVTKMLDKHLPMVEPPCRQCFKDATTCGIGCKNECVNPYLALCTQCNILKGCVAIFAACAMVAVTPMTPEVAKMVAVMGRDAALAKYGTGPYTGTLVDYVPPPPPDPTDPTLLVVKENGLGYSPVHRGLYAAIVLGVALPMVSAYYWVFQRKGGRLHYTTTRDD